MIGENPGYGYRRIGRELAKQQSAEAVNHKRLRRVLKSYELGLRRCLPRSKPSEVQQLVATAGRSADLLKGRSFEVLEAFWVKSEISCKRRRPESRYFVLLLSAHLLAGLRLTGPWRRVYPELLPEQPKLLTL